MYYNPLPDLIREIRTARDLTQTELGEKVGVEQPTVSNWENGKTRPILRTEKRIFEVLGTKNAEIGAALYEIVCRRFGYGRTGPGSQVAPPDYLAKVEAKYEEVAGDLSPEDLKAYTREIERVRGLEAALKQFVWSLEDKLDQELRKAGKTSEPSD
jgi:transcriptional regulator with XRE-family HTH domain